MTLKQEIRLKSEFSSEKSLSVTAINYNILIACIVSKKLLGKNSTKVNWLTRRKEVDL